MALQDTGPDGGPATLPPPPQLTPMPEADQLPPGASGGVGQWTPAPPSDRVLAPWQVEDRTSFYRAVQDATRPPPPSPPTPTPEANQIPSGISGGISAAQLPTTTQPTAPTIKFNAPETAPQIDLTTGNVAPTTRFIGGSVANMPGYADQGDPYAMLMDWTAQAMPSAPYSARFSAVHQILSDVQNGVSVEDAIKTQFGGDVSPAPDLMDAILKGLQTLGNLSESALRNMPLTPGIPGVTPQLTVGGAVGRLPERVGPVPVRGPAEFGLSAIGQTAPWVAGSVVAPEATTAAFGTQMGLQTGQALDAYHQGLITGKDLAKVLGMNAGMAAAIIAGPELLQQARLRGYNTVEDYLLSPEGEAYGRRFLNIDPQTGEPSITVAQRVANVWGDLQREAAATGRSVFQVLGGRLQAERGAFEIPGGPPQEPTGFPSPNEEAATAGQMENRLRGLQSRFTPEGEIVAEPPMPGDRGTQGVLLGSPATTGEGLTTESAGPLLNNPANASAQRAIDNVHPGGLPSSSNDPYFNAPAPSAGALPLSPIDQLTLRRDQIKAELQANPMAEHTGMVRTVNRPRPAGYMSSQRTGGKATMRPVDQIVVDEMTYARLKADAAQRGARFYAEKGPNYAHWVDYTDELHGFDGKTATAMTNDSIDQLKRAINLKGELAGVERKLKQPGSVMDARDAAVYLRDHLHYIMHAAADAAPEDAADWHDLLSAYSNAYDQTMHAVNAGSRDIPAAARVLLGLDQGGRISTDEVTNAQPLATEHAPTAQGVARPLPVAPVTAAPAAAVSPAATTSAPVTAGGALPPAQPPTGVGGALPPVEPPIGGGRLPPVPPLGSSLPPAAAGRTFIGSLPSVQDIADEMHRNSGPVGQFLARSGINPSLIADEPTRIAMAADIAKGRANQMAHVAIQAALDTHAQPFTGRNATFSISRDGVIRNVTPKTTGASTYWGDVFRNPDAYSLSPAQRAYIEDYNALPVELEQLRVENGLRPRAQGLAPGEYYVPRQVKGAQGVEFRRPSNPSMQRAYETMQEGAAKGVNYVSDPRAVMEVHLRNGMRDIVDQQLSDALEPFSVAPSKLIPAPIVERRLSTFKAKLAAERAVKEEGRATQAFYRKNVARDISNLRTKITQAKVRIARLQAEVGTQSGRTQAPLSQGRKIAEAKADLAHLQQEMEDSRKAAASIPRGQAGARRMVSDSTLRALDQANAAHQQARAAYTQALARARQAEHGPGYLFGPGLPETITVAAWRNRIFPRDTVRKLKDLLEPGTEKTWGAQVGRGMEIAGNELRFFATVGNFAAPLTHGLWSLAHPFMWTEATLRHYYSFFNPTVQAAFIRNNLPIIHRMVAEGIPVGDIEMFRALERGGGIPILAPLTKIPGGDAVRDIIRNVGKQTAGRSHGSYNTFLTILRTNLYGSGVDAQSVRNLTGGLDQAGLGVGSRQRQVESLWGAFAPKLLRSSASVIGDLRNPTTQQGREAWKALSALVGATLAVYILTGYELGKSPDEVKQGLNPLNGKRFLSHQMSNGDWIGLGGQVRAMIQLLSASGVAVWDAAHGDPSGLNDFRKLDPQQNPLLAFWSSRGAPGYSLTKAIIDNLDSPPDLAKAVAESMLPFPVQSHLRGEDYVTGIAGVGGLRTSAGTPYEAVINRLDELHVPPSQFFNEPGTRQQAIAQHPELGRLYAAWQASRRSGSVTQQRSQSIIDNARAQITKIGDAVRSEQISPSQIKSTIQGVLNQERIVRAAELGQSWQTDRLAPLYAMYDDPKYQDATGQPDFNLVAQAQEDYLQQHPELRQAWEQNQFVPVTNDPVEVALDAAKRLVNTPSQVGTYTYSYYGVDTELWQGMQQQYPELKSFATADDYSRARSLEALQLGQDPADRLGQDPYWKQFTDSRTTYRDTLMDQHPEVAAALRVFYGVNVPNTRLSQAAVDAIASRTQELYRDLGIQGVVP